MATSLFAGIDLGSTALKLLVLDEEDREILVHQGQTPWRAGPVGTTSMEAEDLLGAVRSLLSSSASDLVDRYGPDVRVSALAASGMGESGFVLGADGRVASAAIAWYDPRGADQLAAFPASLAEEFTGRTGLPLGVQVSVVKLLHLRANGLNLAGTRWLNLPEYVVAALGGAEAAEASLASRTGFLDQDSGAPWRAMFDLLGVGPHFLPPLIDAGAPLGAALPERVPGVFAGARLTVAGHDHLVSSVAAADVAADRYHVSMGTAEVLLRILDTPLSFEARQRLGVRLINHVRHVVPGKYVLVAGVKTGLLMRRVLQLAGIADREGRDRLDERVMELPYEGLLAEGGIEVAGARNDDGVLRLTVRADGAEPAEVFGAVLRHGNDEIRLLIAAMDREVPAARSSLLTGGWAAMRSVQRARDRVLPAPEVSERDQDTAYGAALFARRLVEAAGNPASTTQGEIA